MQTVIAIGLIVFFGLLALAGFLPREKRPNARIIENRDDGWEIEVECPECGFRRRIRGEVASQVVPCRECGCNIIPEYGLEDQRRLLMAGRKVAERCQGVIG